MKMYGQIECYRKPKDRFFWGMAIGCIIGIVLCLAGIVMATKY